MKVLATQSCLTLCDLMDCTPLGSSVCGILQARILEWVTISGDLLKPGIEHGYWALQADPLPSEPSRKLIHLCSRATNRVLKAETWRVQLCCSERLCPAQSGLRGLPWWHVISEPLLPHFSRPSRPPHPHPGKRLTTNCTDAFGRSRRKLILSSPRLLWSHF